MEQTLEQVARERDYALRDAELARERADRNHERIEELSVALTTAKWKLIEIRSQAATALKAVKLALDKEN